MCLCRLLKIKSAAGNFDDLPKRFLGQERPAFGADDLPVVETDAPRLRIICEQQ